MSVKVGHNELTPDDIREELSRILAADDFVGSGHLTRFLQFVVEESLAGREDLIKERTIAVNALARDRDFDARLDPIIRVVAGKLRRALERYYVNEGAKNPLRIEIPKGAYRPVFCRHPSRPASRLLLPDHASEKHATDGIRATARPVLAVVPFLAFTRAAPAQLLADALAQDISVQLSKIGWIEVVDYLVTRTHAAKHRGPNEIASRLHADYALTGTIRKNGSQARVTVQLLHVANGSIVWAEQFDLALHRAKLNCHDAIVHRVVGTIGDFFGVLGQALWSCTRGKSIEDLTAVEAVLHGFNYLTQVDDALYPQALRAGERALRANPDFAWGWAVQAHLLLAEFSYVAQGGPSDAGQQALHCVKQALRADPTCAYAHFVMGMYHLFHGRVDETVQAAEQTLAHSHGSPLDTGCAGVLFSVAGEHERGQHLIDEALAVNPRLPGFIRWGAAVNRISFEDYGAALNASDQFSLPGCFWDPLLRSAALVRLGKSEEAGTMVQQACQLRPVLRERPRELIGKIVVMRDVQHDILDSLNVAGLSVEQADT